MNAWRGAEGVGRVVRELFIQLLSGFGRCRTVMCKFTTSYEKPSIAIADGCITHVVPAGLILLSRFIPRFCFLPSNSKTPGESDPEKNHSINSALCDL
jgi:hypothetical protein